MVCPFHGDKDASLKVYQDGWHCFGCHKGGDVISLARELYGLGFKDAVARLNDEFSIGLDLERRATNEERTRWAFSKALQATRKREAQKREMLLEKEYLDTLSLWMWLDRRVREFEPDRDEEWSPKFCGYLRLRAEIRERLIDTEVRRMALNG